VWVLAEAKPELVRVAQPLVLVVVVPVAQPLVPAVQPSAQVAVAAPPWVSAVVATLVQPSVPTLVPMPVATGTPTQRRGRASRRRDERDSSVP
jgi:hypothetical protein